MPSFKDLAHKKVAGIPVIYLAGAVAIGLAYLAYKMKPATPAEPETPQDNSGAGEPGSGDGALDGQDPYSGYTTTGTVVVQPTTTPTPTPVEQTNEKWEKSAIEYLSVTTKTATVGAASTAIRTYLEGGDLSYEQGLLRDKAVAKLGLPPESLAMVGRTANPAAPAKKPAQKQFTNFPGVHTVKGDNDNTPYRLAYLYYGNVDALHGNKIAAANPNLGPNSVYYSVGTKVKIPTWEIPRYFTATKTTRTAAAVAAKNGISVPVLAALNPGMIFPVNAGQKIRID